MTHNRARIAVIGTGWWSTYAHLPALLANPGAELAALCDSDPVRLSVAADAFQVRHTFGDHREMLAAEQLDGVIVATSHASHYAIARDCLDHGLHTLVEKPLTLHAWQARALVELAQARERELIVGYPWHYSPHAIQAREAVRSGALGVVQFVSCVFSSHIIGLLRGHDGSEQPGAYPVHGPGAVYSQPHLSGGGMGHLQITHSAGLLFFVSGLRAQSVVALMANHGLPLDLVDSMTVAFESGALGMIGGTGNGLQRKLDLQIHCEHGTIDMDLVRTTTTICGPGDRRVELEPLGDEQDGYDRAAPANNLVDVILERGTNRSPGEVGWRTVELLDAAYRSARQDGKRVEIAELY